MRNILNVCLLLILALAAPACYAADRQVTIETSYGTVIRGMSRVEAIAVYGYPDALTDKVWRYKRDDGELFLCLEPETSLRLYPKSVEIYSGALVDFKMFAGLGDGRFDDVTEKAELMVSEPSAFRVKQPGVLAALRPGRYQVMARYMNIISNPCLITVKEPLKQDKINEDAVPLSIHVVPHAPVLHGGGELTFRCFAVFVDSKRVYTVREISDQATWWLRDSGRDIQQASNTLSFSAAGKNGVFCKFRNLESLIQEVRVEQQQGAGGPKHGLRHLTILPEFLSCMAAADFTMTAIATFEDNSVRDVSREVDFEVDDTRLARHKSGGLFSALREGKAEIIARSGRGRSETAKVFVIGNKDMNENNDDDTLKSRGPSKPSTQPGTKKRGGLLSESSGTGGKGKAGGGESAGAGQTKSTPPAAAQLETGAEEINLIPPPLPSLPAPEPVSETELKSRIRKELDDLSRNPSRQAKKLIAVRLLPGELRLGLGEDAQMRVSAGYSDGSEQDVTLYAEWKPFVPAVCRVDRGRIIPLSIGESPVTARYQTVESAAARVIVQPPRLVSIVIAPESARISPLERFGFKAEGVYADGSRRDISREAGWNVAGRSVSADKGAVKPLRFGISHVFAEKDGVASLPVVVNVVVTPLWIIVTLAKALAWMLSAAVVAALTLLARLRRKSAAIKGLRENHAEYIIALKKNLIDVFGLFGYSVAPSVCPLDAAREAGTRFVFGAAVCVRFMELFEEAKYSGHLIGAEQALEAESVCTAMQQSLWAGSRRGEKLRVIAAMLVRQVPMILDRRGA